MFTLAIVINPEKTHVLMCFHNKQKRWNFIGGKVEPNEAPFDASYRELFEETGISRDDITLCFVREENVVCACYDPWQMFVTAGVLEHSVDLVEEKNKLSWVKLDDYETIVNGTFGYGNCLMFLREALDALNLPECMAVTYGNTEEK